MSGATQTFVPIGAPPASPPRISILTCVPEIIEHAAGDDRHWENGITVGPQEGCAGGATHVWWSCPDDDGVAPTSDQQSVTDGTKAISDDPSNVSYTPWEVWEGDHCTPVDVRDYQARARRLLLASQARKIEAELWTGALAAAAGFPNTALATGTSEVTPTPGTPVALFEGFEELQAQIAANLDGRGIIHLEPRLAARLVSEEYVRREGVTMLDAFDNYVVPGYGYPGTGPDGTAKTSATSSFMYATGSVSVHLSPISDLVGDPGQEIDPDLNLREVRAERTVAAILSPCLNVCIEVDWCASCCDADNWT